MIQLNSSFSVQDKNLRDLDKAKDYLILAYLMKEKGVSTDFADYWDKEYDLNSSDLRCMKYDD